MSFAKSLDLLCVDKRLDADHQSKFLNCLRAAISFQLQCESILDPAAVVGKRGRYAGSENRYFPIAFIPEQDDIGGQLRSPGNNQTSFFRRSHSSSNTAST